MSIFNYRQFINWRHVLVDGKATKQPYDPILDRAIDPTDPKNWKTYAEVQANGHPIGFEITAADPFFFLDLDKCRVGDGWRPEAVAIFQMFAGAACEVSQSGTGLHIIGSCNKAALGPRRNKWAGWLEFYIEKRFCAFGPHGWQGNFNQDCTAALAQFVPVREATEHLLTGGPSPNYTGPADDDELIAKMMSSRGSIGASFGQKASFPHLWNALADVLCQHFPSSSGDVYDRSSADAALMAHLAFWTGRDAARMDRLFRRSGLMRGKYADRPDYRNSTITGAISKCAKIYDLVRPIEEIAPNTTAGGNITATSYLTVSEQLDYFKGCTYVRESHRVLIPSGDMLTPPQFKAFYGGKTFAMSDDAAGRGGTTTNAFEAFTENRAWSFPKVHRTCFRPRAEPGAIINGAVNAYVPFTPKLIDGDPTPFVNHMRKLFPVERDREILTAYFAALRQYPGYKFQWAPVIQGTEGNGKTLLPFCLEYAIGDQYSHRPNAQDLANPFNSYIENKLLISVEEVKIPENRMELLEVLKPLITNDRVEVQPKGVDKRMVDNVANWIFLTNHRDAIPRTIDSRRYAIFFTAQQDLAGIQRDGMDGAYFPNLYDWLKNQGGLGIVAHYLQRYTIPDELNPATRLHRAPVTSSTPQAMYLTRGKAEQELIEAIEADEPGFRNGWMSSVRADVRLRERGINLARVKMGEMIESLGYSRVNRSEIPILEEDGKRPILYIRTDLYQAHYGHREYGEAQGYQSYRNTRATGVTGQVLPLRRV